MGSYTCTRYFGSWARSRRPRGCRQHPPLRADTALNRTRQKSCAFGVPSVLRPPFAHQPRRHRVDRGAEERDPACRAQFIRHDAPAPSQSSVPETDRRYSLDIDSMSPQFIGDRSRLRELVPLLQRVSELTGFDTEGTAMHVSPVSATIDRPVSPRASASQALLHLRRSSHEIPPPALSRP